MSGAQSSFDRSRTGSTTCEGRSRPRDSTKSAPASSRTDTELNVLIRSVMIFFFLCVVLVTPKLGAYAILLSLSLRKER